MKRLTYVWVVETLHDPYLSKKLQEKQMENLNKLLNFIRNRLTLINSTISFRKKLYRNLDVDLDP